MSSQSFAGRASKPDTRAVAPVYTPSLVTDEPEPVVFPTDFVWGAATAAFQIEGSTDADGRGPSIWDTFCATPGKILGGDTGDPAADHYRRYPEDIALIKELGIGHYRFSIAWPRVQPDGRGPVNQAGLDFYERLVDHLLEHEVRPWPTLYHWDLPQALETAGGWPHRDTAMRFADYTASVHERLGDRVADWSTLNEPWVAAFLGYASGDHAPGRTEPAASLAAVHHLLLGHGLATQTIREQARGAGVPARVGIVLNAQTIRPRRDTVMDRDAARRIDALRNRIFLDPIHHGHYPADLLRDVAHISDFGFVRPGDLATIQAPLDMMGVNFYNPSLVADPETEVAPDERDGTGGGDGPSPWPGSEDVQFILSGLPRTGQGWEVDATGLRDLLVRLAADYPRLPLYVTENGAAYEDTVAADGGVHDPERRRYLEQHIRAANAALKAGAPLKGYFVWSLLDNLEWAFGYSQRFGIIHVDHATQRRVVKDSGYWYGNVARTGTVG